MQLGSSEKGKKAELAVFGELLERGVIPYVPLVDTKGIDAIIQKTDGSLVEIQVKGTFSNIMQGSFNIRDLIPKDNLFIVGVIPLGNIKNLYEYWIFPSQEFADYAQKINIDGHINFRLDIYSGKRNSSGTLGERLNHCKNNWDPLIK
jgi:hypothetical protein